MPDQPHRSADGPPRSLLHTVAVGTVMTALLTGHVGDLPPLLAALAGAYVVHSWDAPA